MCNHLRRCRYHGNGKARQGETKNSVILLRRCFMLLYEGEGVEPKKYTDKELRNVYTALAHSVSVTVCLLLHAGYAFLPRGWWGRRIG